MILLSVAVLVGVLLGLLASPELCIPAAGILSLVTYGRDTRRRSNLVGGGYWRHFREGVGAAGLALIIFAAIIGISYALGWAIRL